MDVAAYLASEKKDEVRDRLQADVLKAVKPVVAGKPVERYGSVADYDPVLRAHCRL
jgi:hypothetical protein